MKRLIFLSGFAFLLCSCNNSGTGDASADSSGNATIATDTNNASKSTGVDMSGGVNSGNLNDGDTTGIDLKTGADTNGGMQQR
jgi:hypothetical protein